MSRTVNMALIFQDAQITFGPRDAASQAWLVADAGKSTDLAMREVTREWMNRRISKRDLAVIAAHFESVVNRERMAYERCTGGPGWEEVRFRVRVCEYRDVVREQELVEL